MTRLRASMSFALRCGASLVRSCCIAVQLQRFLPLAFRSILLAVGACSAICWCTLALVKEGYSTGCSDVCGCAASSARTSSRVVAWIALKAGRTHLPGKRLRRRLGFRSEAQLCALRFGRGLGRRRPARSRSPLAVGLVPFSCIVDGGSGAHAAVNSFRSGLGCSFGAQCILPELGEDEVWSEAFESGGGSGAGGALAHDAFGGESGAGGALAGAGGGDDVPLGAGDALASAGEGDDVTLGAGDALAGSGEGDDVTLGAGDALAGAVGDPFRGGAGGSSVTRRKRTEKMLASLTELLKGWADGEGETAEENAAEEDGSYEALFTQLEQLIWQRPADPVGALAALFKEWQAPPRKVQVAPRWASRRRSSEDWHDEWTSWAEWDNHWSQDAPRGRWGRKALASWEDSAIDADYAEVGWTEVTRRKRRQKDKQPGAQKPKPPEVAVARGQPAKGKGKGRGAAGGRASWPGAGGDAGAMRASDWCPRAADWTAGTTVVSTVDEMWEDLTLDYVICPRSEGELDRLKTLVLSSESPPDVTIVLLKSEAELEKGRKEFAEVEWAEARIPGTWRGHVRVASTWMAKCSSDAPSLRQPTIQPKAPTAQATCVLRVHADWVYCERGAKAWAEITQNPGAHFRSWAAASFGSIKDTWKWQLTRGQGGAEATIEGLIRMPVARAASALSASGQRHAGETWFVSNVSRNQEIAGVPELAVHWQEWEPAEEWSAYLARCRRASQAADFGLARGAKQLGIRRVASEEDLARPRTVRRLWRACGVPRDWSFDEISEFLKECHFDEPEVEERMPWRGATSWSFRATMPADEDFFVFHVGEDTIEITRVGKDSRRRSDRALPLEIKQVFGAGRKQRKSENSEPPKRIVTVTASQDTVEGSDAANAMSIDGGSDRPRLDDGKSLPSAADDAASKRPRTAVVVNDAGPQVPGGA